MTDVCNEKRDRPEACEIEITPEMVEAGAAVLCGMDITLADEEFWAKEIFRAMAMARSSLVQTTSVHDSDGLASEQ